jgi:hypothetical protein
MGSLDVSTQIFKALLRDAKIKAKQIKLKRTVTLGSSNNALPDDGDDDCTETCRTYLMSILM